MIPSRFNNNDSNNNNDLLTVFLYLKPATYIIHNALDVFQETITIYIKRLKAVKNYIVPSTNRFQVAVRLFRQNVVRTKK